MAERRFTAKTLFLFAGLLIWAAHFIFVYSANAVACARGLEAIKVLGADLVPFTVSLATLAALAAAGYVLVSALAWKGPLTDEPHDDPTSAFARQITIALTLLSIIAIVLSALLPAAIVRLPPIRDLAACPAGAFPFRAGLLDGRLVAAIEDMHDAIVAREVG